MGLVRVGEGWRGGGGGGVVQLVTYLYRKIGISISTKRVQFVALILLVGPY